MSNDSGSVEDDIVNRFIDSIDSSDEISEDVSDVISAHSNEDDFGGRKQISELVLEAVITDED